MKKIVPTAVDVTCLFIIGLSVCIHVGLFFYGMVYDPLHPHTIHHVYESFTVFSLIIHAAPALFFVIDILYVWIKGRTFLHTTAKILLVCVPVASGIIWHVLFRTVSDY